MKDPFALAASYLAENAATDINTTPDAIYGLPREALPNEHTSGHLSLEVNRTEFVESPIKVTPWLTIVDVEKSIEATLADLRSYVAARNQGQEHHWVERLLDEKFATLRVCGVEAQIRQIH